MNLLSRRESGRVNVIFFETMRSSSKRAIIVLKLVALCIGANVFEVSAKTVSSRPIFKLNIAFLPHVWFSSHDESIECLLQGNAVMRQNRNKKGKLPVPLEWRCCVVLATVTILLLFSRLFEMRCSRCFLPSCPRTCSLLCLVPHHQHTPTHFHKKWKAHSSPWSRSTS